jgi:hypothetical protein
MRQKCCERDGDSKLASNGAERSTERRLALAAIYHWRIMRDLVIRCRGDP